MSCDEQAQELDLLAAFKQRFGITNGDEDKWPPKTHVLEDAQYIYDNAIDVSISMSGTETAATTVWELMQKKHYSPKTWSTHELHPSPSAGESTVNFIFTMDLLNYSFWSELGADERFAIEYRGRRWTGYWSLVAALQRALDEAIPITEPAFWHDAEECTDAVLRHVFRSATAEEIPLFPSRGACLREAGRVLCERYDGRITAYVLQAQQSAAALVTQLARDFACFRDEAEFHGRRVCFLKRAQILVADLWACFEGAGYGEFHDIDIITMFADYRIPQMLHHLSILRYSPPLTSIILRHQLLLPGDPLEVQLRGCSIWAVELLLRCIRQHHPDAQVNAILVDFFLYDWVKEHEAAGGEADMLPHHRTRSIWY